MRIVTFSLGLDTQWEVERMADVVYLKLKAQEGFLGFNCFHEYDNGEYYWLSYWDTKDHLEASFQKVYPFFREMIGDCYQRAPLVQVFSNYTPKNLEKLYGN